jgi:hypothetical protein
VGISVDIDILSRIMLLHGKKITCNHAFIKKYNNFELNPDSVIRLKEHEHYILHCKKCEETISIRNGLDDESIIKLLDFSTYQNQDVKRSKNYRKRKLRFRDLYMSPRVFECEDNKHIVEKIPKSIEFRENEVIEEEYLCLLCHKIGRVTIFSKSTVNNILDEVEDTVGSDKKAIGLLNSIADLLYQSKEDKQPTNSKDVTPEKLNIINLRHFRKNYTLIKFRKDRNMIIDILLRHRFIEKSGSHKLKLVLSYSV